MRGSEGGCPPGEFMAEARFKPVTYLLELEVPSLSCYIPPAIKKHTKTRAQQRYSNNKNKIAKENPPLS